MTGFWVPSDPAQMPTERAHIEFLLGVLVPTASNRYYENPLVRRYLLRDKDGDGLTLMSAADASVLEKFIRAGLIASTGQDCRLRMSGGPRVPVFATRLALTTLGHDVLRALGHALADAKDKEVRS